MTDVLKDVPEFFEAELGESLLLRTEGITHYRELGPPDLCHIAKMSSQKSDAPKLGSFHHVFGIDASSMASVAAYINTLLYAQGETQGWFGKGPGEWRITSGVYCCYNAFSRVDTRVEVTIPGGTDCYVVDARGERRQATAELWQETYLSAIIRSILYSDDHRYPLRGFRRHDPIPDLAAERRFLDCVRDIFWKGPQLGTDPEIQIATTARNHLTRALLRYFGESWRWELAASMLEKLAEQDAEVAGLLARAYFGMDEEVRAVRILNDAVRKAPASYGLLLEQVEFLRQKGELEWARDLARYAVDAAPSEFVTWSALADVYADLEDTRNALLTLNSCPMFTYNDRDRPRMPMPIRAHYIVKPDPITGERIDELDPEADGGTLPRLAGAHLKGTFARAYSKLSRLAASIGWDELLKYRSQVFVMEEEYRQAKAQEEDVGAAGTKRTANTSTGAVPHVKVEARKVEKDLPPPTEPEKRMDIVDDGVALTVPAGDDPEKTDEVTSHEEQDKDQSGPTVAVVSETTTTTTTTAAGEKAAGVPTNVKLPDSDDEDDSDDSSDDADDEDDANVWGPKRSTERKPSVSIAKPKETATEKLFPNDDEAKSANEPARLNVDAPDRSSGARSPDPTTLKKVDAKPQSMSFAAKRLCERWLDNLFMVLYEDLRAYTIWRAELAHHRKQGTPYNRPPADIESLADLALRLHKRDEARQGYEHVVATKYSVHSWTRLLEIYSDNGEMQRALEAVVYLAKYHDCHFNDVVYPHVITYRLNQLIRDNGLSKVTNTLISIPYVSESSQKLVQRYLNYAKAFGVEGCNS